MSIIVSRRVRLRATDGRAWCGTVITVAVDSGVSSVSNAAVVGSVSAFRGTLVSCGRVVVAGDGVLDLVDDARHVVIVDGNFDELYQVSRCV